MLCHSVWLIVALTSYSNKIYIYIYIYICVKMNRNTFLKLENKHPWIENFWMIFLKIFFILESSHVIYFRLSIKFNHIIMQDKQYYCFSKTINYFIPPQRNNLMLFLYAFFILFFILRFLLLHELAPVPLRWLVIRIKKH